MDELERLEMQVDAELDRFGRSAPLVVSDALARKITGVMTREYHREKKVRWIARIGLPVAAAAAVILMVSIFGPGTTTNKTPLTPTEITSIWSLGMDDGAKALFADLDFEATTTQPASLTNEEMEKYFIEAIKSSS